jgi:hypothetical protein
MKKFTLLLLCLFIGMFWVGKSFAQGYTPPSTVLGISLDGILATNDAHGSDLANANTFSGTYGMVWGRGISLNAKFGLGVRKNHRITVGAHYKKMTHDGSGEIPFFNFSPVEPFTDYTIYSGSAGYEYAFNPRCKNKQFVSFAFTANYITQKNTIPDFIFDDSFRFGFQISSGYEWTLDKAQTTGVFIGVTYNLANILGTTNGVGTLNDASGSPGPGYWRRIGTLSINLGFNLYTGVKPYRAK